MIFHVSIHGCDRFNGTEDKPFRSISKAASIALPGDTVRIHAGVYRNPWIEMDRSYEAADLPENLVVEGFQMDVKIKIRDRGVKS